MPNPAANALVFLSSAAVLVLEILAARLLAPYVGATLETYTAIIGTILAGIAVGSWLGGKIADRRDPRTLIAPLLIVGGALGFLAIPLVDLFGGGLRGATATTTTVITAVAFFLPAAVLSAVTPSIIKLQLASLHETGTVVGRLSGISTAGAIVGTFLTGFVLVGAAPTRIIVRGTALFLILLGVVVLVRLKGATRLSGGTAVFVLLAAGASFLLGHPCEYESRYYCAYITADDEHPSGRALWLDTLRHSYVDLDDPTHLEFAYTQLFGDVADSFRPEGEAVTALHVGGGGFTMPRYLRETRPGSDHLVLEVDPLLIEISQDELGLDLRDDIEVATGDARLSVRDAGQDRFELVVGDAFGGVSVPWHLATEEFLTDLDASMTADGVLILNVIDYGPRDFLRAELATVGAVFGHVAVLGPASRFGPRDQPDGGNVVVVASQAPLDLDAILVENRARGGDAAALSGSELDRFVGDAPVLTDDRSPVDQLLTPLPTN
ncbi:MAG: fused MFS/spermidine synthase [Nitriliruptor sp.]|uniref:fused MFS/spermidine synthase n=1 Tax=Nitriliruptor sp. TaxID=2448056 RepID=UPI0034A0050F